VASGHIGDGTALKVLEALTMTLLTGVSRHRKNPGEMFSDRA
jgi:hypothetical protein